MNIDLRNIDFEDELKKIMKAENFATASKCIRSVVLEHLKLKENIRNLKANLKESDIKRIKSNDRERAVKTAIKTLINFTNNDL